MVDYYKSLGLTPTASHDEIRKAYRTLAKKYHPDANPDNEEATQMFEVIAEAYAVLSDEAKKSEYDRKYADSFSDSSEFPYSRRDTNPKRRYSSDISPEEFFKNSNVAFEDFFSYNPNKNKTNASSDEKVKPVKTKDMFRAFFGDDIRF
jgi:DnaJ-class molecular chaperone